MLNQTLKSICELQPHYSNKNTPEMQERGRLINRELTACLRSLSELLSKELGTYGDDFFVSSSDGIGSKTEAPWARFCSKRMSPSPRDGYYVVIHFKRDGSGIYLTLGCGSTAWRNGALVRLKPEQISKKTKAAVNALVSRYGKINTFTDEINLGAKNPLPKSFEQATAIAKFINYNQIDETDLEILLVELARYLKTVYDDVQATGADLSEADQAQIEIENVLKPKRARKGAQGFGLNSAEKRVVELRAMQIATEWLLSQGYETTDTSANESYDILAKRNGSSLFVEVKGTTSQDPLSILMTANEGALHQENKGQTALAIVSAIKLQKGTEPKASSGKLDMNIGWDIDDWVATPTAYRLEKI